MNTGAGMRILKRKDEFIQMWHNGVSSSEMGYHFSCNNSTINIWAKKFGLERRHLKADCSKHFEEISECEIRRRCEEVQAGWDAQTEWSRRVEKQQPLRLRHMLWNENGFVDNGICQPIEMIGLDKFNEQLDRAGHRQPASRSFND